MENKRIILSMPGIARSEISALEKRLLKIGITAIIVDRPIDVAEV